MANYSFGVSNGTMLPAGVYHTPQSGWGNTVECKLFTLSGEYVGEIGFGDCQWGAPTDPFPYGEVFETLQEVKAFLGVNLPEVQIQRDGYGYWEYAL